MREILFRGKRTDNGEWVFGFYEKYSGDHYICFQSDRASTDLFLIREMVRVVPETVGQYTGLTDAFCKKIFEGDLVTCDRGIGSTIDKLVFEIMFNPGEGFFGATDGGSDIGAKSFGISVVVGNIHDNPELLK